jgi:hypothetical protein
MTCGFLANAILEELSAFRIWLLNLKIEEVREATDWAATLTRVVSSAYLQTLF